MDPERNLWSYCNVAHNERKKRQKTMGIKNNFADELLKCMDLIDSSPFVQHVYKSKVRFPNFILYDKHQMNDFQYFVSHQGSSPLGIDRTFNLGPHWDATFEAYHTFFSTVKASLCKKSDVKNIDIITNKERTLCTKHLKDNVLAYMQNKASVKQKARQRITEKIFGDNGLSSADDSIPFDKRCKVWI